MLSADIIFPIFIFFFLATIWGGFLWLMISAQKQLEIEAGKTPLYKVTGGGQIGLLRYRGPFISLRIYEEFAVIKSWKAIVIRYEDIERVELKKWLNLITEGVEISYRQAGLSRKIILGVGNPHKTKDLLDARRM